MHDRFMLDENTGKLFWKQPPKNYPHLLGKEAGYLHTYKTGKQRWKVKLNGRNMLRSRIVFYMTHGRWPEPYADHINGNSLDDRPCNLREATHQQNMWNVYPRDKKTTLPMGVYPVSKSVKFGARIGFDRKIIHIGVFDTPDQAHEAYLVKRRELFGEYNGL